MIYPWKYTLIRYENSVVPLIHCAALDHDKMAHQACRLLRGGEPMSAGFISEVEVAGLHGYSETLKLGSDPQDGVLMNMYHRTRTLWPGVKA